MPIVYPQPSPQKKWYESAGELQGTMSRQVTDALIQALMAQMGGGMGQMPTVPTAKNPGTFNFPPGSSSPGEQAQIQQMGGVPTNSGFLAKSSTNPTVGNLPPSVSYQPPTQAVNLNQLIKQTQLQKAQQDLDPNSPMNQYLTSLSRNLPGQGSATPAAIGGAGGDSSALINKLATMAHGGDEEAITMLRQLGVL